MHSVINEGQKQPMEEFRWSGASSHGPVNNTDVASIDKNVFVRHRVWMQTGNSAVFLQCGHSRGVMSMLRAKFGTQNTVTEQYAMFFLRPVDVVFQKDGRRRLEECRFLMWRFDVAASELGLLRPRMTELDCSTSINASIEKLGMSLETPACSPSAYA